MQNVASLGKLYFPNISLQAPQQHNSCVKSDVALPFTVLGLKHLQIKGYASQ